MSQKPAKTDYKAAIRDQLRHPLKLRMLLAIVVIVGWYVLFLSPLSQRTAATTARIARERKRVTAAREIEQLKKDMTPFKGRVPTGSDVNELMRHVIAQIRSSPLKLLDLKPEKSKDLGPYEALGLKLTLEGQFGEIDEFLRRVEINERLLRIDAIKLDPTAKDPRRLTAQITLVSLGEKAAPATAKAKPEPGKKS